MAANKEDLLASFRSIVEVMGEGGERFLSSLEDANPVETWEQECLARFAALREEHLRDEIPSRYANGVWSVSLQFQPVPAQPDLPGLRQMLDECVGRETGWPVFLSRHITEDGPRVVGDGIETWFIHGMITDGSGSDFWRVESDGRAFLLRGYDEDATRNGLAPGTTISLSLPIWRVGEVMLWAARFGPRLGAETVDVRFHWTGLKTREVVNMDRHYGPLAVEARGSEDDVVSTATVALNVIEDSLPDVVGQIVGRLFAAFDFLVVPRQRIEHELGEMRK